jgi:hypothetical protein
MEHFVFLFPEVDILEHQLERMHEPGFRELYKTKLNACIDARYRQKGFQISYAILKKSPISDLVEIRDSDQIIEFSMDSKTHRTEKPNGEYDYPDFNEVLYNLKSPTKLRIGGFHIWDCVDKLAKLSYEKGLDTLVDEDLTDLLIWRLLTNKDFEVSSYPSFNPREIPDFFEDFMEARKKRPWLHQNY